MVHSSALAPNKQHLNIAQCHDANISSNQVDWPPHVSWDISALSDIECEFQFSVFRGTTFRTWLSLAIFIFSTCYQKFTCLDEIFEPLDHQWFIRH